MWVVLRYGALGKTSITLGAINSLIYDYFEVNRVLVIAPIRVADMTWDAEIKKWDHLSHLTIVKILGGAEHRRMMLTKVADIYTINRENVQWLVEQYGNKWPFDMVVVDELSSFKNPQSKRFKALKKVMPFVNRFVGLTGTPAPRSLMDLWPQLYLMDKGKRLGKTLSKFRSRYFKVGKRNGHIVYDWVLLPGAEVKMQDDIRDICMSLKAKDWLDMPKRTDITIDVSLPSEIMKDYKQFEREKILELGNDKAVVGSNAGVVLGKLLQYSSGMLYDDEHDQVKIHDYKLEALGELIEEANGKPVLVFYYFKFDFERIMRYFPQLIVRGIDNQHDIEEWNSGKIDMLLVHPASVGHGLNLQEGGNIIIWYTLPNWNLELYQQANARLHRQGQRYPVFIYHLLAKGTVDEDVMQSLMDKEVTQNSLMEALKAKIKRIKQNDE